MVFAQVCGWRPTRLNYVTLTLNPSPRGRDLPSPLRALTAVFRKFEDLPKHMLPILQNYKKYFGILIGKKIIIISQNCIFSFMKKFLLAAMLLSVGTMAVARNQEKFDRGIGDASAVFVPKGMMTAGASISYSHYSAGNGDVGYELMSLITGLEGTLSTVKISPAAFYFIGKNTAVGARVGYSYTSMNLDGASISLGADDEFDLSNHYVKSQSYSGQFAVRNYVPLFGSRVFGMFNEIRIGGSRGQGKSFQYDGNEKNGTFSESYALTIGIVPGLTMFLTNNLSFEVSISVLECNYSYTKQTKNQVYTSSLSHFGTTFKPNLLGVGFSIMYYFQVGKR